MGRKRPRRDGHAEDDSLVNCGVCVCVCVYELRGNDDSRRGDGGRTDIYIYVPCVRVRRQTTTGVVHTGTQIRAHEYRHARIYMCTRTIAVTCEA